MTDLTDPETARAANRAAWDHSAQYHRGNADWQRLVAGVADPGFSTFDATATKALQEIDLAGKSCVQVGCNNGREVLSLMALGAARAVGIDQSEAFLTQARELAALSPHDAAFVAADIYALPEGLGRFDLALITIGVLNWMPDLPRFFEIVAGLLAPGGRLLLYETHPFLEMFDPSAEDPFAPSITYFPDGPDITAEDITYDGNKPDGDPPESYWYCHSLGAVVSAIAAAGLRVEQLHEYPHSNREVDYDIYTNRDVQVPMCYLLQASQG